MDIAKTDGDVGSDVEEQDEQLGSEVRGLDVRKEWQLWRTSRRFCMQAHRDYCSEVYYETQTSIFALSIVHCHLGWNSLIQELAAEGPHRDLSKDDPGHRSPHFFANSSTRNIITLSASLSVTVDPLDRQNRGRHTRTPLASSTRRSATQDRNGSGREKIVSMVLSPSLSKLTEINLRYLSYLSASRRPSLEIRKRVTYAISTPRLFGTEYNRFVGRPSA
ncbi:hypothetical protein PM082_011072 [Marasmius tenuissimus]|nr:hypothetical protein PM082_011072 [Marasmius tenuissimus]